MPRLRLFAFSLLGLVSVNLMAKDETTGKYDISGIETQERQQIISELSWHLNTKKVCGLDLKWDDGGSGAEKDGYFFLPPAVKSEYIIGGYGSEKRVSNYHCVITVSEASDNPKGTPPLLAVPSEWKMVWKDSGSGANKDGSMWQAIPPNINYRCLGSIPQSGYNKPDLPNYRCVHNSLTKKIEANILLWTDKGSGAEQQVSIFKLPQIISFIAVPARVDKIEAYDLIDNATSVPDPKKVEAILAERLAPLKADLEAKMQAKLAEQKKLDEAAAKKKAAERKRLAEEAEQKKVLAQAAQESAAVKAEKKMIQEKEEAKRLAEEAEKKKQAEAEKQKQAAEAAVQKQLTEKIAQENTAKEKAAEPVAAIVEEKPETVEKTEATEPEAMVQAPVSEVQPDSKSEKKGSKGLDDLLFALAKNAALLFGGLILFYIIFKLMFRSKKKTNTE